MFIVSVNIEEPVPATTVASVLPEKETAPPATTPAPTQPASTTPVPTTQAPVEGIFFPYFL